MFKAKLILLYIIIQTLIMLRAKKIDDRKYGRAYFKQSETNHHTYIDMSSVHFIWSCWNYGIYVINILIFCIL